MRKYFRWMLVLSLIVIMSSSCTESREARDRGQAWTKEGQRKETVLYSGSIWEPIKVKVNKGDIVYAVTKRNSAAEAGSETDDDAIDEEGEVGYSELFYYANLSLSDSIPKLLFQVDTMTTDILDFWPDGSGNVYYISLDVTETEENIYLKKQGTDGITEIIKQLNNFYQEGRDDCYEWKVQTVPGGGILVYSPFAYLLLDNNGNKLREDILENTVQYSVVCMDVESGFVQAYENYRNVFYVCGRDGKKKEEVQDISGSAKYVYGITSRGEALISTDSALYCCNRDGELELLCIWADYGIVGDNVVAVYMSESEMHCLLFEDGILTDVTYLDSGEAENKSTELTLGCFGETYWLRNAVAQYNKESDCVLVIVDYWQEDTAEAVNRMYNDILAGKGPDIIGFESTMVNDTVLGRAGMLEDLTVYLERSDVIVSEDFVEPLYQALEDEGKRYMLPTNFIIEGIITKERWAGGDGIWTPEECLEGVEENKNLEFGIDRGDIADILGMYGLDGVPDGQEYIGTYLKIGKYLPEQKVYNPSYEVRQDGKLFMELGSVTSVEDYLYNKAQWGDDIRYMGFPGAEGNGMAFMPVNCYGISSGSAYKEEAWSFLESLFAQERREAVTPDHYFSAYKKGLEEQFDKVSEIKYYEDENGSLEELPILVDRSEGVNIYAARPEDIEEVRKMIGGIKLMRRADQAAAKIIGEEAGAFYAGDRSLEETIGIIKNRIGTLMSEK